jgi:hypothetical protein
VGGAGGAATSVGGIGTQTTGGAGGAGVGGAGGAATGGKQKCALHLLRSACAARG